MATGYNVEQQSMARGAQALEDATQRISTVLKTLDADMQSMAQGWQSDASRVFMQLHMNWSEQQNKLVTALQSMHETLVSTSHSYVNQESQQSSSFQNIANAL
jgi:WXG100 family type VII secretion target